MNDQAQGNIATVKEAWEEADTNTPEYARLAQLAAD